MSVKVLFGLSIESFVLTEITYLFAFGSHSGKLDKKPQGCPQPGMSFGFV